MVAQHVKKRNVEPAHQVFEVVEWQVTATQHDVGFDPVEPVAIVGLVDLVGDGEDARGLETLEAERGPDAVDGDEGDRLVPGLRRDLAKDVALDPPGRRGKVRGTAYLAALRIGDPQQAVWLGGADRRGPETPQLGGVLHEEEDGVICLVGLQRGLDVGRSRVELREVAVGRVQDGYGVLRGQSKLLRQWAEPGLVRSDYRQRALRVQVAHAEHIKGMTARWLLRTEYHPRRCCGSSPPSSRQAVWGLARPVARRRSL